MKARRLLEGFSEGGQQDRRRDQPLLAINQVERIVLAGLCLVPAQKPATDMALCLVLESPRAWHSSSN